MKNTIKTAIKATAFAAALIFSGASHADTYNHQALEDQGGAVLDFGAKLFKGQFYQTVAVYEMSNTSDLTQQFLAFCVAPTVDTYSDTVYTAHYGVSVSKEIQALYETSFDSVINNSDKQVAFQLALWELNNDDSNLYANTGAQYFTLGGNELVADAQKMIDLALGYKDSVQGLYNYTTFTGVNSAGLEAQELMGVSAVTPVPEVETTAMILAGLGLVGVMGRRQKKNAKFA